MKNLTKKIMILGMVGIMQVGFGITVSEASPAHASDSHRIEHFDNRQNDEWQQKHDERIHREDERHEREMKRHHGETEREWHKRQERENQRHEDNLREIEALLIGVVIGANK